MSFLERGRDLVEGLGLLFEGAEFHLLVLVPLPLPPTLLPRALLVHDLVHGEVPLLAEVVVVLEEDAPQMIFPVVILMLLLELLVDLPELALVN